MVAAIVLVTNIRIPTKTKLFIIVLFSMRLMYPHLTHVMPGKEH